MSSLAVMNLWIWSYRNIRWINEGGLIIDIYITLPHVYVNSCCYLYMDLFVGEMLFIMLML